MTKYWVPWYSGVVGNEKVDTSAKNAPISDEINQQQSNPVHIHDGNNKGF